jgi:hypothetical protein
MVGMSDSPTSPRPVNLGGRPARWGKRHSANIRFPVVLHAQLKQRADAAGLALTEYVSLLLAPMHGIDLPDPAPNRKHKFPVPPFANAVDDQEQPALPLGA